MKMALWTSSSATTKATNPSPTRQYRLFHQRARRSRPGVVIGMPRRMPRCLGRRVRANCWESMATDTMRLTRAATGLGGTVAGTAASMLLAGAALVASLHARLRSPSAGGAAAAILALSGFSLVEYVFGSGPGLGWARYARMAVHTATAVGASGVGLWCLAW